MKLVIAEKPMLAHDIARAICGRDVPENARLPISGNGWAVCACAGHLLELKEPDEVDSKWAKPWSEETLPIVVHDWPKKVAEGKEQLVDQISRLLSDASLVVNAGDPDDEGQLIVDELLDYLHYDGKVMRVYVNDNIEANIRRAFEGLRPNDQCRKDGLAAYARQMADFSFGATESRLASLRLGSHFTVGRVQTPTLGLVVARDETIENHEERKYYELFADVEVDSSATCTFQLKPDKMLMDEDGRHVFDSAPLVEIARSIKGSRYQFATAVRPQEKRPPLPFNLTRLQSEMNRLHGMTAQETLDATQHLRDDVKAITYNRTDSQYLKPEHFDGAPKTLATAMMNIGASWELDFSIRSRAFDASKVTAHHAIIPQDISFDASALPRRQRWVYQAVVERYAMQFAPPAVYDVSLSEIPVKGGRLVRKTRHLRSAGWLSQFADSPSEPTSQSDSEPDPAADRDQDDGPFLAGGPHHGTAAGGSIKTRRTAPPKPYTEGTLIADMSAISKYVTDPEMKRVLKEKDAGKAGESGGIGTTATRAAIIEALKDPRRGYLVEKSGKVHATEKGRAFYHALPAGIGSADVTARWWLVQQDVAAGRADANAVQDAVAAEFENHRDTAYVGVKIERDALPTAGPCPLCGEPLVVRDEVVDCSSNRSEKSDDGTWHRVSGCGFKMSRRFMGKRLTPRQAERIVSGERVAVKGLKSRNGSGRSYGAWAVLSDGPDSRGFYRAQQDGFVNETKTAGFCPLCGEPVKLAGKLWSCSSNRSEKSDDGAWHRVSGCGFKMWAVSFGKKLTAKQAASLFAGDIVHVKGLHGREGDFEADLYLPDGPGSNGIRSPKIAN